MWSGGNSEYIKKRFGWDLMCQKISTKVYIFINFYTFSKRKSWDKVDKDDYLKVTLIINFEELREVAKDITRQAAKGSITISQTSGTDLGKIVTIWTLLSPHSRDSSIISDKTPLWFLTTGPI